MIDLSVLHSIKRKEKNGMKRKYLCHTKKTKTVKNQMWNKVEPMAVKDPDVSLKNGKKINYRKCQL